MFKRFLAVFKARNLEFFRDRSSLGWNIIFPVLLLGGFAIIFGDDNKAVYKVGLLNAEQVESVFSQTKYIDFVNYSDQQQALLKLKQHKLDLLLDSANKTYWVNSTSPNGYIVELLLLQAEPHFDKQTITGKQIRYVDFLVPGILAMNMMFSCLFGVGYVIVRYRKNMVLKRLGATPLTAFEFVSAQVASRMLIVIVLTSLVFVGCDLLLNFYMLGSYFDLLVIATLGAICLVSLGLLVASRSKSEELTGGLLNMTSWPMMILSGVWFSLEGAPEYVTYAAQALPLTHIIDAARAVMTSGATLADVSGNIMALIGMILLFLALAAAMFQWHGDGR